MADDKTILPSNIAAEEHFKAFDLLAGSRLNAVELEALLVYLIDTVEATALPYLAAQFGVAGFSGYRQATTEQEKRDLIKQAIKLQRLKGTVWAVKEAMRVTGYAENSELVEHYGDHWAKFIVRMTPEQIGEIDVEKAAELTKLILEYKNVRSWYMGLTIDGDFDDTLSTMDDDNLVLGIGGDLLDTKEFIGLLYCDGEITANGAYIADAGQEDILEITITTV